LEIPIRREIRQRHGRPEIIIPEEHEQQLRDVFWYIQA
jgi:hypothetical protein